MYISLLLEIMGIDRLEDHSYCLYNQLDYDDSYSDKEMKFLAKFITPDDSIFDSFILIGW